MRGTTPRDTNALVDDYLRRLGRAARTLSRDEREEILGQVRDHIAAATPPDASEADLRNLLADLGSPEAIVAAAGPASEPRRGAREVAALILLVTGFPPLLGWLVGLGLLLWSPLWSARQKLLGILVWPGGYVFVLGLAVSVGTGPSCPAAPADSSFTGGCSHHGSSVWTLVVPVLVLLAPLVVALYLYRVAGRPARSD